MKTKLIGLEFVIGPTIEIQNIGDATFQAEIRAVVEHALDGRPGDWRVSLVGSRDNDQWELRITGPQEFERTCTLDGAAGQTRRSGDTRNLGEDATSKARMILPEKNVGNTDLAHLFVGLYANAPESAANLVCLTP